jgi:hypothetical protein
VRNNPGKPAPVPSPVQQPRAMYPIREARQQLGGISHTTFYHLVSKDEIRLIKLGRRSFVSADEIRRITGSN